MPTSYGQNLKFTPKPESRLDEFTFDGGLITDEHETKLKSNQSPNLYNVLFNEESIKTRNGYLRYNTDPIGQSSNVANTGAIASTVNITSTTTWYAQTFKPSGTVNQTQVDLYMAMNTLGQQQLVRVEIWATSTGLPSVLATRAQILLVSGTSETKYSFRFLQPVALISGTTYAIVVRPWQATNSATINQVNISARADTYADGSVISSTDTGVTWTADTSKDLRFEVFTGGETGCTGLMRFYGTSGIKQLLAKFGTTLYRGNDSTGAMTALTLGSGVSLTAGNFLDWTISNNTLLVVDGTNKIQKYRGSTNVNYSTGTLTATNASATITGSGTSWNTVTNAEVGEYIQLPDTKWYKITAISTDTSLTIERTYQGSTLAGQTYKISPWGEVQGKLNSSTAPASLVRPTPSFIETHINRVWTASNNSLYFSVLDTTVTEENFNDFDTSNNAGQINVPTGKGDTITGIYSLNNSLYVFQRRAIWRLYGNSPANFELRNVTNEIGMIDKRTLVEWGDFLIFLSDFGIQYFDGSNLQNVSDKKVNKLIATWANKTSPTAVLWDNKYVLSYSPSGTSYNTQVLVLDLTSGIYSRYKGVYAGIWSGWAGSTDANEVYFGSSNQGSIYKWNTGGNDDGFRIETIYDTPSMGFNANVNDKTQKKFYIQQVAKDDYDMMVTMLSDLSTTGSSSSINLLGGTTSLWDTAVWDTDVWSTEGSLLTNRIAEFQGIAKFFKFSIQQEGYNQGIEVLGISVTERVRRLT